MCSRVLVLIGAPLIACSASTVSSAGPASCDRDKLVRIERRVPGGDPGIELFVQSIATPLQRRGAVVLVHGAGSPSSSIWDLRLRDYSMLRALACAGFDAYGVDVRGYGGSTFPNEVRAADAAKDVGAAMRFAAKTSSVTRVDLVAWSWGCDVAGIAAGAEPERVRRIVMYAPVFDRQWPTRHRTQGGYRIEKKSDVLSMFDPEREEREVWLEHVEAMFRFSPSGELKLPNGPYRDLYGPDAPIWNPSKVKSPVMILRGDRDLASLELHARRLYDALTQAPEKRYVVIAGAGHVLPREKRYRQLHGLVIEFLTGSLEPSGAF